MLRSGLLFLFLGLFSVVLAQQPSPVKWTFAVKQSGSETELLLTATIKSGFHVYSQYIDPEAGPIPTTFTFTPGKEFDLVGKVTEGKATEYFDENFGVKLKYFSDVAVFSQKILVKEKSSFTISGVATFMVCDDKRCFPPEDMPFSFTVNGNSGSQQ